MSGLRDAIYRHAYVVEGLHCHTMCQYVLGRKLRISVGFVFFVAGSGRIPRYMCYMEIRKSLGFSFGIIGYGRFIETPNCSNNIP